MTKRTVEFYKEHYEEFQEFKKKKGLSEWRILHMITNNVMKYYGFVYTPDNTERIYVKLQGEKADFDELERFLRFSNMFLLTLPQMIYNFMQIHKDDTFRRTGSSFNIYFNFYEWNALKKRAGNKPLGKYIKEVLFKNEYMNKEVNMNKEVKDEL